MTGGPRVCRKTARAEDDLIELWLSIAIDNPAAADRLLDRIDAAFQLLAQFPEMGPTRTDLAPELRYHIVGRYLLLYKVVPTGVEVVRVVHGARHLPDLF